MLLLGGRFLGVAFLREVEIRVLVLMLIYWEKARCGDDVGFKRWYVIVVSAAQSLESMCRDALLI